MKTTSASLFFILLAFFIFKNYASNNNVSENSEPLYRYNLVGADTYSADSGFDSSTPVEWLWDGSTAQGVNDSKAKGGIEAWIEFVFEEEEEITEAYLWQDHAGNKVTHWKIMYWEDNRWKNAFSYIECKESGWQKETFDIKTNKVRFYAQCIAGSSYVSIHEIELYSKPSSIKKKKRLSDA